MKTLKNLTLLSCLVLGLSLLTFSCKKDTPAPLKTLDGKFVGHFNIPGDNTDHHLAFSFNTDNTLIAYEESMNYPVAKGTWSLNGDVVTGEFFYDSNPNTTLSFTAIFSAKTGMLTNGSWGFKPNIIGGATFTLSKQEANRFDGTFVIDGSTGIYPMAFELYADGTVLYFENTQDLTKPSASGKYTLVNDIFLAPVKYIYAGNSQFLYKANYSATSLTNGTWGVTPQDSGFGVWSATKK